MKIHVTYHYVMRIRKFISRLSRKKSGRGPIPYLYYQMWISTENYNKKKKEVEKDIKKIKTKTLQ